MRWLLLLSCGVLFTLGCVMIFDTTSAEVLDRSLDKFLHYALFKHLVYALLGILGAYILYQIGPQKLIRWSPSLLALLTSLLVLCFFPGIGRSVNGSHRWVSILGFTFQPSEFVVFAAPAYFLYRRMWDSTTTTQFLPFLKAIILIGIPVLLILIEPNHSTFGLIAIVLMALFFLTEVPLKFWLVPVLAVGIAGAFALTQVPYFQARLQVYWNPELDLRGKGHQPYQGKIAAGSGELWGRGIGNSLQKMSYLPEAQNDYIAAIYAEETGFVGVLILIGLYTLFAYAGFGIAYRCLDPSVMLLAAAITFAIVFQAFLNLGVVSGLLPSTGINLPFFSQGGTSLIANLAAVGVLLKMAEEST